MVCLILRSVQELQDLDKELNLFDEEEWSFIPPDDSYVNFEYFNDVQDIHFSKHPVLKPLSYTLCFVVLLVCCSCISLFFLNYNTDLVNNNVVDTVPVNDSANITYISGNKVSNSDLAQISMELTGYFTSLQTGSAFDNLNSYCKDGSVFCNTYNVFTNKMKSSYDANDCYARIMCNLGMKCSIIEINKVVEKNGVYYCYVDLKLPDSYLTYSYILENKYSLTKYFTNKDLSNANIVRAFLTLNEEKSIPYSVNEYCIEFERVDDNFMIRDDSIISSSCVQAYTNAVTYMEQFLGNGSSY